MKVSIHEIKHQIDITIVLCADNILQTDDVLMPCELLQEDNLSECALGISCILKSVKILLQGYDLFGLFVDRFPNDTICSLTYRKILMVKNAFFIVKKEKTLPNFWSISYFLRT